MIEKLAQAGSERAQTKTLRAAPFDARKKLKAGELTAPGDPRVARFHELEAELNALTAKVPARRFGYRPALDGLWRMLTSMSAHAGWLHWLGNMWFLYLVGCSLEDRWGRFQFATFYVTFVEAHGSHTPVAHSAHAGGFLFGAAFALVLRKSGIDSQLDAASETAFEQDGALWQENPLYVEAMTQRDSGGVEKLIQLLEDDPKHEAGRELLLELGLAQRDLRALDLSLPFSIERQYCEI